MYARNWTWEATKNEDEDEREEEEEEEESEDVTSRDGEDSISRLPLVQPRPICNYRVEGTCATYYVIFCDRSSWKNRKRPERTVLAHASTSNALDLLIHFVLIFISLFSSMSNIL